jgi:Na+/proline symporter
LIGSLGNIVAQDLLQRVFAARSAGIAQKACWISGVTYLAFGSIPVLLGLASRLILPDSVTAAIVPGMAMALLHPGTSLFFTLALASAVLSTLDSAILAPASVLSHNVLAKLLPAHSPLKVAKACVLVVAGGALITAYAGTRAYTLLEDAYALGLVALLAPFLFGMYRHQNRETAALLSMLAGFCCWLLHRLAGWNSFLEPLGTMSEIQFPVEIAAASTSFLAFLLGQMLGRGLDKT